MPNVHLTKPMEAFVDRLIQSGEYANVSEVMRAGIRTLMDRQGARQFYQLKTELEEALAEIDQGQYEPFDPAAYEPEAFTK